MQRLVLSVSQIAPAGKKILAMLCIWSAASRDLDLPQPPGLAPCSECRRQPNSDYFHTKRDEPAEKNLDLDIDLDLNLEVDRTDGTL